MKKFLIAALLIGSALPGVSVATHDCDPQHFPPKPADCQINHCNYRAIQQEDATGQNFEGVAWGTAGDRNGGPVSVRCYTAVNGSEVSSTPTGSGIAFAATAGRLTYSAGETDVVTFHAEVCTTRGCFTDNYETERFQIPPQEVIDAINAIVIEHIDPALCSILDDLAGTYGPVVINEQGDIYVDGSPEWDCPPYDIWPPA